MAPSTGGNKGKRSWGFPHPPHQCHMRHPRYSIGNWRDPAQRLADGGDIRVPLFRYPCPLLDDNPRSSPVGSLWTKERLSRRDGQIGHCCSQIRQKGQRNIAQKGQRQMPLPPGDDAKAPRLRPRVERLPSNPAPCRFWEQGDKTACRSWFAACCGQRNLGR